MEGDTSSFECAHQLGKLCEHRHLLVNLIPYNQTDVKDKLRCPSDEHMDKFKAIVCSYGAFCTIRRTMGADIASACGQLVVAKEKEKTAAAPVVMDIEDVGVATVGPAKLKTKVVVPKKRAAVVESKDATDAENDDDFEKWEKVLTVATGVAATAFIITTALFLTQRRRR